LRSWGQRQAVQRTNRDHHCRGVIPRRHECSQCRRVVNSPVCRRDHDTHDTLYYTTTLRLRSMTVDDWLQVLFVLLTNHHHLQSTDNMYNACTEIFLYCPTVCRIRNRLPRLIVDKLTSGQSNLANAAPNLRGVWDTRESHLIYCSLDWASKSLHP